MSADEQLVLDLHVEQLFLKVAARVIQRNGDELWRGDDLVNGRIAKQQAHISKHLDRLQPIQRALFEVLSPCIPIKRISANGKQAVDEAIDEHRAHRRTLFARIAAIPAACQTPLMTYAIEQLSEEAAAPDPPQAAAAIEDSPWASDLPYADKAKASKARDRELVEEAMTRAIESTWTMKDNVKLYMHVSDASPFDKLRMAFLSGNVPDFQSDYHLDEDAQIVQRFEREYLAMRPSERPDLRDLVRDAMQFKNNTLRVDAMRKQIEAIWRKNP